uniref:Si:ch211-197h24.6 n=1 Tax=Amphilophus citrinellus TaxID=61819 RepID=A0A3Q0S9J0_AMPCI
QDILMFSKGSNIHTVPSLSKILKGVTDCVIGLQYVWEYRSPSKSVAPHYQCKLCAMASLQHDIIDHVKGWKHCYRYMKKTHPDKITNEEEDAVKDPAIRKSIKEAAAEVEKTEGRGQIKVSPRFSEPRFPGEFPPDYPVDEFREPNFGGYSSRQDFPDSGMDQGPFMDGMGHGPGGRDGYRRSGLLDEGPNKTFLDEFKGSRMGSSLMNRPGLMGAAPESSSLPHTLLSYLDTFRIENESDAQLVLKVTQKLTDVLMEYRLRSVSSVSSTDFCSSPPRMQSGGNRYSGISAPCLPPEFLL